jgi:non-heme chloroperoxidase
MSFITTADSTKIFYQDVGEGEPVVLIHGWPVNADMWENQTMALLERGFRVISYDRRGFGRSDKPAEGYDYDTFASDLNQLLIQLNLRGVTLVGFSMGGGEIVRYVSRFGSERVVKAAFISSVVPYLLQTDTNPDGVPIKAFDGMIAGLRDDRPKFLSDFGKTFFGVGLLSSPVSAETLQWISTLALQASLKATIDCVRAFSETDFRAELRSWTIPTLIVHGTGDKTVPIKPTAEAAAKLIPSATMVRYDGAPHGLFITHKDDLNRDLVAFMEDALVGELPESRSA